MTGLSETISHLTRLRRVPRPGRLPVGQGELTEIPDFGGELASNPGNLRMMAYVPAQLAARPALVIVLHGCGQDAASFATASGWIAQAERQGFIICAPEQRSANNSNG